MGKKKRAVARFEDPIGGRPVAGIRRRAEATQGSLEVGRVRVGVGASSSDDQCMTSAAARSAASGRGVDVAAAADVLPAARALAVSRARKSGLEPGCELGRGVTMPFSTLSQDSSGKCAITRDATCGISPANSAGFSSQRQPRRRMNTAPAIRPATA